MLTAIFDNGTSVANPKDASANAVEVHQNRMGEFELHYSGTTLLAFKDIDEANQAAAIVSRGLGSGSGETYAQRYSRTTEWNARHIAQDLMNVNGKTSQVSAADEKKIATAETIARGEEMRLEVIGQMLS